MKAARDLRNTCKKGKLEVICGSMFSGKSEELMRRLRRAEHAKQKTLIITHKIDTRRSDGRVSTHDGNEVPAYPLGNDSESILKILALTELHVDVIGIDEVQFFHKNIIPVIQELVERGKRVITAGLDLDFRGEPFSILPILLTLADEVVKLKAICMVCSRDAHHTQRVINGKPAKYNDPIVLVGAKEYYEARCRDCFFIDKQPWRTAKIERHQKN